MTDVAVRTITGIGLCAGVGWLDLAAKLAWEYHGYRYRTLALAERDSYAASILLARMEDKSLEPAAICDSIEDIDERFRGVDCVVAGFPCTDISCAGKRAGLEGTRSGLWFDILRCVRTVGAEWLFLENVAAITSLGLDAVLGSLAESGFDAEWLCLKASDVGASHKRDRWFCVAHTPERGQRELRQPPGSDGQFDGSDEAVGDTSGLRLPHAEQSQLCGTRWREQGRAIAESSGAPLFAPGPSDERWPDILRDYPWLAPAIESHVHRIPDGSDSWVDDSRADKLRCVGNGVVVLQAATAFVELMRRFA